MAGTLTAGAILTLRDDLSAKLERARGTAKRFVDQIHAGTGHIDKFTHSIVNSGAKMVQHFGAKASAMLDNFFGKLKLGATIGVAALGAMAFKGAEASMDFEAQIRHATGLLVANGASSAQADQAYTQFADGILAMAPKLAKAPDDLAKSLYLPLSVMAQYGEVNLSVADTLKVVEAASKAATAGFADSTTVTTALSRVLGAYGAGADQATHYTDIMQQAVNYGLMTFSDLATGIGKVAGPAAALQIPFEQIAAAISTITRRGILPDEAFTALNKVMLAFEKPHPEAIAGLEAMFGPQWKEHISATALATKGLDGVIQDLMGHVKPTTAQMAALSQATDFGSEADVTAAAGDILGNRVDSLISVIGDVRGLRGLLALTADSGGTSFATALGLTENATGAVQKQFDEYRKTTQYAKDEFSSFIQVLEESVIGGILPNVGGIFQHMNDSLSELTSNPVFQDASVGDKLKMIGSSILDGLAGVPEAAGGLAADMWDSIVGWWDEHHSEVEEKVHAFFIWLGDTAIPWMLDLGAKLAGVLAPALLHGLGAAISSPEGLAVVGGAAALKFGGSSIMDALKGGGAAASTDAAASQLSMAATQLQAAATALLEAAGAEDVAAAELGAGGAAGALTKSGGFFAGGLVANVAAVTIAAATVYMAAKVWSDQRDNVQGALGDQQHAMGKDLAAGDYGAIARGYDVANANSGLTEDIAGHVFGTGTPKSEMDKQLLTFLGGADKSGFRGDSGKLDELVNAHDTTGLSKLKGQIQSSGVFDKLDDTMKSQILQRFDVANDAIKLYTAKQTAQSLFDAGVRSIGGQDLTGLTRDQAMAKLDTTLGTGDGAKKFIDSVSDLATQTVQHQGDVQRQADHYQHLAEMLRDSNPLLSTFYQNLASFLGTLANWTPPTIGPMLQGPMPTNPESVDPRTRGPAVKLPGDTSRVSIGQGGPQAHGSVGTAWGPTSFTAGEAGTEDYAFAPHAKGGLSGLFKGAGSGLVVNGPLIGHATVREEADVEKIAAQLAYELEKRGNNAARGTNE